MNRAILLAGLVCILAQSSARAEKKEDFYTAADGVKIHYTDEGSGDPVLLIHGYRANADLNWRLGGTVARLAEAYRVITIDNRGHGQSDKPTKSEDYGVNMVGDAIGLLDHLDIKRAHVVGYSMGGMITMKMLATHPERVESAVISGMGWWRGGPTGGRAAERIAEPRADDPLAACAASLDELTVTEDEIRAIKVPMACVIGANDQLLNGSVEPLRELRPEIPLTLIPNSTHMNAIMKREFADAIRAAVDKQKGS